MAGEHSHSVTDQADLPGWLSLCGLISGGHALAASGCIKAAIPNMVGNPNSYESTESSFLLIDGLSIFSQYHQK